MLISSLHISTRKDVSTFPLCPSVGRITICYNQCGWVLFVLGAWPMHLEAVHFFSRGSGMDMLTLLVSLIPRCRHTWQWRRDPRYYIHTSQWVCVHRGPSVMFLNWHIGEESPSWYLSRQPVIIAHLCLLIVRSFPAVRARVGGLWSQAQGGLSWPWDTREAQPRPHSSGMLWLLIRLSTARSLGIGPSKAFHDRTPEPRVRWFRIAFNSCCF